jgi:hypothetical protein
VGVKKFGQKEMPVSGKRLEEFRRVWEEAVADNRPGVPAAEVFARLLRKYGGKVSKSG